jgi:hypothetical protein
VHGASAYCLARQEDGYQPKVVNGDPVGCTLKPRLFRQWAGLRVRLGIIVGSAAV